MSEYIVRMPPDMPYEIKAELNAWYVESEPIVRGKACKGYRPGELYGWCSTHMTAIPREDGFCAWGVPADSDEELSNRGLDEGRKE